MLAAALAHTPEAEEALRGARTRMARKPAALARELLRNFPKGRRGKSRRRRKGAGNGEEAGVQEPVAVGTDDSPEADSENGKPNEAAEDSKWDEPVTEEAA